MITTLQISADELNISRLKAIKEMYKGKEIEIIISDEEKLSLRQQELLRRIQNVREDRETINFEAPDFFETYRKKINDSANSI